MNIDVVSEKPTLQSIVSNTLGINTTLVSWCVLSKIYKNSTCVLICFDSRYRSAPAMHGSNVRVAWHGHGTAPKTSDQDKSICTHVTAANSE